MACNEFTSAYAWAKQTTSHEEFPVVVYFTKQFGYGEPYPSHKDAVVYASGNVFPHDSPARLTGTLKVATNIEGAELMGAKPDYTFDVEIFEDGKLSYLMKIKGIPVGGITVPTTVQAACVNGVLLTGTTGSEVVTVGFARKPSVFTPA